MHLAKCRALVYGHALAPNHLRRRFLDWLTSANPFYLSEVKLGFAPTPTPSDLLRVTRIIPNERLRSENSARILMKKVCCSLSSFLIELISNYKTLRKVINCDSSTNRNYVVKFEHNYLAGGKKLPSPTRIDSIVYHQSSRTEKCLRSRTPASKLFCLEGSHFRRCRTRFSRSARHVDAI